MSLGIYGGSGTPQLYTMMTTKRLNLIYIDGQSAALTTLGTLDSQMALLQNEVPDDPKENIVFNEGQRAIDLCALTKFLKIDGVVRMNAGFEVMLCNYVQAGVEQLYSSNVTVPGNRGREEDATLPHDPNRVPPYGFGNEYAPQNSWEWIRSGAWHYGASTTDAGSNMETRVQLNLCGFLTYYDPFLRSLSGSHHGGARAKDRYQNGWGLRRGHRLLGISHKDIATVKTWLEQITTAHPSSNQRCSEINWQALTETITNQHRTRAREILATMKKITTPTPENIKPMIRKIHELSHAILYTYLQYPTVANISAAEARNLTIMRCSSVYTGRIESHSLNDFEVLIKESISIVMSELCSWEWELFEWSELHTTNLFGSTPSNYVNDQGLVQDFDQLLNRTESVINWIGWSNWHDCERKCESNELCYIPMWPVIYAPGKHQGGIYADESYTDEEMYEFWRPKCLNRTLFDRGGGRGREPSHQLPDVPIDTSTFFFP
ncbi:hypothetical protein K458DRAFT_445555 [Lentithecium fluviatile CBS 122367]|uniref:Uncharacterized protein n=1 Tax=Lentithecium fluviatile CBS 122367 TaxID=1168545 RepID=A0A6G1INR8_9PLEO|nr:hypothetical protein K458DRAFT_445555 [Lentithecium fluviatile CBS 122367]